MHDINCVWLQCVCVLFSNNNSSSSSTSGGGNSSNNNKNSSNNNNNNRSTAVDRQKLQLQEYLIPDQESIKSSKHVY